jgi:DNA-binding CsgD family transcriptional regulator
MATPKTLDQGRDAFNRHAWSEAYTLLSTADRDSPLAPEDLTLLAISAYLTGMGHTCTDSWNRAHHSYLKQGNLKQATYCSFWLGMILLITGQNAQGSGWIARTGRLIEDHQLDCVEKGFLLVPKGLRFLNQNDNESAFTHFTKAEEIGKRFKNADLIILSRLSLGQALIQQNKISEGTTLFDEVMIAVLSDEISPIVAGIVYCAVIETCQKIYDLKRAQEWTAALSRWCESQPDLVPFRGQCLVRRVEIMQLQGKWEDAVIEVQRAFELLSRPPGEPAAGEASYRMGELHRLRGNFSKAEEMYRQANKLGRKPQPGLALLRLAQGDVKTSTQAIRRIENEKTNRIDRAGILPAYVIIMLAADHIPAAKTAAGELSDIADDFQAPLLQAIAARSQGNTYLAGGDPHSALNELRLAQTLFKKQDAAYESARTRWLIGLACLELGDEDSAELELDAARWTFRQLGAIPDLEKIDSRIQQDFKGETYELTQRELEVLRLLATGKTNKMIASELFISERTVDRHVSNILSKLNVSSRAAATAYAYEHDLI